MARVVGPSVSRPVRRSHFLIVAGLCFGVVTAGVGCKAASDAGSGGAKAGSGGSASGSGGSAAGSGGTTSSGGVTASGGVTSSGGASGGVTGTGGTTSSGGTTDAGGATGSGGAPPPSDGGTTDAACQMASYAFVPMVPTVYVMVDRSGSMFDCLSTTTVEPSCATPNDTPWVKLMNATLSVITSLQGQVRFGFAAFTGTDPAHGGKCPMIDQVNPAVNNAMAISDVYTKLPFQPETTETGKKFETPARQALDMIGAKLMADPVPGDKYILFVTDGQPDYCDDSNVLCAPDSVIGGLQALKAKGITTIVIGLQSKTSNLPAGILQAYANAGAGENTLIPLNATDNANRLWDECNGLPPWKADFTLTGKAAERGATIGTYAATAGPTKAYAPDVSDQAKLVSLLGMALAGVKSCTFDLGNINGQSIKVDPTQLSAAHICLGKTCPGTGEITQDATNGWSMATDTQVILNGTACTAWRMPTSVDISFDFPCKSIIFE